MRNDNEKNAEGYKNVKKMSDEFDKLMWSMKERLHAVLCMWMKKGEGKVYEQRDNKREEIVKATEKKLKWWKVSRIGGITSEILQYSGEPITD